jgi:hypothetical protein
MKRKMIGVAGALLMAGGVGIALWGLNVLTSSMASKIELLFG